MLIVRSLRKTIAHLKSVNVLEHLNAYDADIAAGVLTRECEAIEAARQQHLLQKQALRNTKNRKHKRDLKQLQQQDANIETGSFAMLQSGDAASAPAAETTLVKILRQPPANAQQLLGAQAQAPAFVQELLFSVLRTHDRLKLPANHRQDVILQTLKLASAFVEWRVPTHVLARNRLPKYIIPTINAEAFAEFSSYLNEIGAINSEETHKNYILQLRRLFSMVEVVEGSGATDWVSILCSLYQNRTELNPFHYPLFGKDRGWTGNALKALEHFVDCYNGKASDENWMDEAYMLEKLKRAMTKPFKKRVLLTRQGKQIRRKIATGRMIANMPPRETRSDAVFHAMVALDAIVAAAEAAGATTAKQRADANTCIIFIIHCNGFAGRSGEWVKLLRDYVKQQLRDYRNQIGCLEHKTFSTYGELGKYIADGIGTSCERYMAMPGSKTDKFLEPVKPTATFPLASYLKRACQVFLPDYRYLTSNLLRKQMHSLLRDYDNKDVVQSMMSKIDAHGKSVAEMVYTTTTIEQDVKLAKVAYECVNGAPEE